MTPHHPRRVIRHLTRELATVRLHYANLLAAARAALAAAREGESYALEFLADELVAQHGQTDLDIARITPPLNERGPR